MGQGGRARVTDVEAKSFPVNGLKTPITFPTNSNFAIKESQKVDFLVVFI